MDVDERNPLGVDHARVVVETNFNKAGLEGWCVVKQAGDEGGVDEDNSARAACQLDDVVSSSQVSSGDEDRSWNIGDTVDVNWFRVELWHQDDVGDSDTRNELGDEAVDGDGGDSQWTNFSWWSGECAVQFLFADDSVNLANGTRGHGETCWSVNDEVATSEGECS